MTTVGMIQKLRQRLDMSDVGIDMMVGSLLLHAKADEVHTTKLATALEKIIEEAGKHATDESPDGWLWISIVVTAKEALGLPTR